MRPIFIVTTVIPQKFRCFFLKSTSFMCYITFCGVKINSNSRHR